ncbi:MAG: BatD family protein [Gammaproteobacteria bacterium]|nr:BatD family protein [Gammaproteobacteria bacterium]
MNKRLLTKLAVLALCLSSSAFGQAGTSLDALLANGELKIKTWLQPDQEILVSQQVNLNIEIATQRWFSGGTRIAAFEVEGAVVLRREKFAVNSSRRINSKDWAVQLWTITLYPQQQGLIEVPPIALNITVAGKNNQSITGDVFTSALGFEAHTPVGIGSDMGWIATPEFEVEEHYDKALDDLKPGDSVGRTVRFKGRDVAAMMLPEVVFQSQPGLAVYQTPPRIKDTVSRGEYLAERTESISYLIEKPGTYSLPALQFHWWNLQEGSLQTIVLPAKQLSTSGATIAEPPVIDGATKTKTPGLKEGVVYLAAIAGLIMVVFMVYRALARRPVVQQEDPNPPRLRHLEHQFVLACQGADYVQASSLLYQWLDHSAHRPLNQPSVRRWLESIDESDLGGQFGYLMQLSYGPGQPSGVEVATLLKKLKRQLKTTSVFDFLWHPSALDLN